MGQNAKLPQNYNNNNKNFPLHSSFKIKKKIPHTFPSPPSASPTPLFYFLKVRYMHLSSKSLNQKTNDIHGQSLGRRPTSTPMPSLTIKGIAISGLLSGQVNFLWCAF
jgi:hypothetical protein